MSISQPDTLRPDFWAVQLLQSAIKANWFGFWRYQGWKDIEVLWKTRRSCVFTQPSFLQQRWDGIDAAVSHWIVGQMYLLVLEKSGCSIGHEEWPVGKHELTIESSVYLCAMNEACGHRVNSRNRWCCCSSFPPGAVSFPCVMWRRTRVMAGNLAMGEHRAWGNFPGQRDKMK